MSLEQIGQTLKSGREANGLSLRQIYDKTRIPLQHLQSIETGQTEDLPELVYVSGYIRRYADCIGLNGESLVNDYKQALSGASPRGKGKPAQKEDYTTPVYVDRVKIATPQPMFKDMFFSAFWVIVVVALISYLTMSQINNQGNQQDPSLSSLKEATSTTAGGAAITNLAGSGAGGISQDASIAGSGAGGAAPVQPQDSRISLSASQHVWVEVKAVSSGENLFTGYLEPGERRDFQDGQGVRVRAGNAGSLSVTHQGKVETFGAAGKIAEREFLSPNPAVAIGAATPIPQASSSSSVLGSATASASVKTMRKPVAARQTTKSSELASSGLRHLDDVGTSRSSSGSSTRSLDVPYRYDEGHLDAE